MLPSQMGYVREHMAPNCSVTSSGVGGGGVSSELDVALPQSQQEFIAHEVLESLNGAWRTEPGPYLEVQLLKNDKKTSFLDRSTLFSAWWSERSVNHGSVCWLCIHIIYAA